MRLRNYGLLFVLGTCLSLAACSNSDDEESEDTFSVGSTDSMNTGTDTESVTSTQSAPDDTSSQSEQDTLTSETGSLSDTATGSEEDSDTPSQSVTDTGTSSGTITQTDEDTVTELICVDNDSDGYGANCLGGEDCDDGDPSLHQAVEVFLDQDHDGYGVGSPQSICAGPAVVIGWAQVDGDCDDVNPEVHPGMPELADDGFDNDCSDGDVEAATILEGVYVAMAESDSNPGTRDQPVGTVSRGIEIAKDLGIADVFIESGYYNESVEISETVRLHGGYEKDVWTVDGGMSVINARDAFAVRITTTDVSMTRLGASAFWSSNGPGEPTNVTGISIEGGSLFLSHGYADGGSLTQYAAEADTSFNSWAVSVSHGSLTATYCNIYPGDIYLEAYGSGPLRLDAASYGIFAWDSDIRLISSFIERDEWNVSVKTGFVNDGPIVSGLAVGLSVSGGTLVVSRSFVTSLPTSSVCDDVTSNGGPATAIARSMVRGVELSGVVGAHFVNSVIQTDTASASTSVNVENYDAMALSSVQTDALYASESDFVLAHCDVFAPYGNVVSASASSTFGTSEQHSQEIADAVRVQGSGRGLVLSNAVVSMQTCDQCSIFDFEAPAAVSLVSNLAWDYGAGVCFLASEAGCELPYEADAVDILNTCDDLNSCVESIQNVVADPGVGLDPRGYDTSSPLYDGAVDPTSYFVNVPDDVDGNNRPAGSGYDIGYYELPTSMP